MDLAAAQGILLSRPRGRPPVLSREDRRKIAERYKAREPVADLAAEYNVSTATIYRVLGIRFAE